MGINWLMDAKMGQGNDRKMNELQDRLHCYRVLQRTQLQSSSRARKAERLAESWTRTQHFFPGPWGSLGIS